MSWELDQDRPIYLQLMEHIQQDILMGIYKPGERLPSVRDLALKASVNPNTMQKALSELERSGLVYSQRTSGRFITDQKELLEKIKNEQALSLIREFLEKLKRTGLKSDEILSMIQEAIKEELTP